MKGLDAARSRYILFDSFCVTINMEIKKHITFHSSVSLAWL